jgi:hypothetical protein
MDLAIFYSLGQTNSDFIKFEHFDDDVGGFQPHLISLWRVLVAQAYARDPEVQTHRITSAHIHRLT